MASTFYDVNNAYPRTINLGAKDNSKGELTYEKAPLTWHIPLIYIFSNKGKSSKVMGNNAAIMSVFGNKFTDSKTPYFQHPSNLYNILQDTSVNGGGGATCMIKRLIPEDAKVRSNLRLYLDIIKGKVPNYKRNSDGSFWLNGTGKKELDDTTPWIDGYFTRWTKGYDKDANKDALSVKVNNTGSVALWKMEEDPTVKHVTKDETTVDDTDTGHTAEANNTIYVYENKEDMYMPTWKKTTRKKCVIDGTGRRTSNDEETLGDPDTFVRSIMYPIAEFNAAELGTGYDNCGFVIESFGKDDISSVQIQNSLALPYKFYYVTREDKNKSGQVIETLDYERYVTATLKADDWNYDLDVTLNADDLLPHAWFNETDPKSSVRFYDVEEFNLYRENIETILKDFLATEKPHITTVATSWEDTFESDTFSWTDFFQSDDVDMDAQYGLLNIFTAKYSDGAPMFSVVQASTRMPEDITDNVEIDMNISQQLFMQGGQDGTLTRANFEELVCQDIAKYGDINDLHYQNLGVNQETIVWDTGFEMNTKLKLAPFIAVRKGTSIVLSTFVDGEKFKEFNFTLHQSRADKLRKAMVLYPESETYGTPASRGAVWIGYGKMSGSQKQYPITLELACKINRYVGPSTGMWDDNYIISLEKNKKFTIMHDIHPRDLAHIQQDKLNRAGSNYPLTGSEGIPFISSFKTIYDDSTSGLYSFITNQGLTVLDRVQYQVWEKFTGYAGTDTNEALLKRIQEQAIILINGVCGSGLKMKIRAEMTEADVKRGFSYQLIGEVYSSTMKTVQVYHTEIYRISSEG